MNENLKPARKAFSRMGLALVVIMVVTVVAQLLWTLIPLMIWGEDHWLIASSWGVWLGNFVPMYLLGIPAGLLVLRTVPGEKPVDNKLGAKYFWMALPIAYFFTYAGSLIGNTLSSLLSGGAAENAVAEMAMDTNPLKILVMVILAPLLEEYICRKQIIDRTARYGEKTAVVFSALLFGLFHGNFFQFFYAFGVGLVLGYIYIRTGRLRYTVGIHAILNFLGAVVAPFILSLVDLEALNAIDPAAAPEEVLQVYASMMPGLLIYMLYAVALFGIVITGLVLLIIVAKRLNWKEAPEQLPAGARLKTAYLNVGMILFFVMCAGLFALALLP